MKKITLLFSCFLLTSLVFGQINITELERVDGLWTKKGENKPYNDDFKETFEDGSKKGTGTFVNGATVAGISNIDSDNLINLTVSQVVSTTTITNDGSTLTGFGTHGL